MIVLGITGGIGSGKNLAADYFRSRGAVIVDADEIAREVVRPGSPVLAELVTAFGDQIVRSDGTLDRRHLAHLVFGHPEAVAQLNAITHPVILREVERRVMEVRKEGTGRVVCVVAPLLLEAGGQPLVDKVLVMTADVNERIRRIQRRDGVSREEVQGRIDAQWPSDALQAVADWVVDNSGNEMETRQQLEAIWKSLEEVSQ